MSERLLAIHGNKYQPMRRAEHHALNDINTSPDGKDWSKIIAERSDSRLAQRGLFKKVSYDAYGTVLPMEFDRMLKPLVSVENKTPAQKDDLSILLRTQKEMKEALATNGVGDSFIHTILPDLNRLDKLILIRAGLRQFEKDSGGIMTQSFWPAETTLDTETLEVLADEGIKKVIGAPWQVRLDSGEAADNQPTKILLPNGKNIVILPFSRNLQEAISWGDRTDAPRFIDKNIIPSFEWSAPNYNSHQFNFIATDMETFGGHDGTEGLDEFLEVLYKTLPEKNIKAININELDVENAAAGSLVERSSWSCKHGDLRRWHGPCDCHGPDSGRKASWKTPYYSAHHRLNGEISEIIRREGIDDEVLVYNLTLNFADYLKNPGDSSTTPFKSLLSAKASALAATTSCATFFEEPGTSGFINPLFALQSIYHLRDAGLISTAERVEEQYLNEMNEVTDPNYPNYTGRNMVEDLLSRRIGRNLNTLPLAA